MQLKLNKKNLDTFYYTFILKHTMNESNQSNQSDQLNNKYAKEFELLNNHYRNFKIEFENIKINDFANRMEPFIFLVNQWSCILGLSVSKCNNYKIRRNIVANLFDENCDKYTHVETFYFFINECKSENFCEQSNSNQSNTEQSNGDQIYLNIQKILHFSEKNNTINKYYTILKEFIETKTFEEGCQFLGAIEYVYHLISKDINEYFEKSKGIAPLNHYTVHEYLDTQHAFDLFECSYDFNSDDTNNNLYSGADWIICVIKDLLREN